MMTMAEIGLMDFVGVTNFKKVLRSLVLVGILPLSISFQRDDGLTIRMVLTI